MWRCRRAPDALSAPLILFIHLASSLVLRSGSLDMVDRILGNGGSECSTLFRVLLEAEVGLGAGSLGGASDASHFCSGAREQRHLGPDALVVQLLFLEDAKELYVWRPACDCLIHETLSFAGRRGFGVRSDFAALRDQTSALVFAER